MDKWTALLTAFGAAGGLILTAVAKIIKARADEELARAESSKSKSLLRRLWDRVEAEFAHQFPTLAEEIRDHLLEADEE